MKNRVVRFFALCSAVVFVNLLIVSLNSTDPEHPYNKLSPEENPHEVSSQLAPNTSGKTADKTIQPIDLLFEDANLPVRNIKNIIRKTIILKKLTETGRQGTKGRLVINNYSFSVALYESDERSGPNAQSIVDAEDSAVWFMWFGSESPIVADHCTQGFDIIKDCKIGDVCYIVDGDDYQEFECIAVDPDGINDRTNMYLSSGYDFMRENEPGYLYMYTCSKAGDSYHITVAIWTPVEEDD